MMLQHESAVAAEEANQEKTQKAGIAAGMLQAVLIRHQRLLLVLGIQGSPFTVILDQKCQVTRCVSHSRKETRSCRRQKELNSGVGTGGYKMEAKESVRNFVCG